MNKVNERKASLVDFLRSIKFAPQRDAVNLSDVAEIPLAHLQQQVVTSGKYSAEDTQLIRSAN